MKNFGIKSDKTLDLLRGDVKTVINKTYNIRESLRELAEHSVKEYDTFGQRILSIYFEKNDCIQLKQVSIFDDQGNIIGYTNYNANELQVGYGNYDLDYKKRIVRRYYNGEIEETYKYDDRDNITEVYFPNINGGDRYQYDTNGFAIRQIEFGDENALFASLLGDPTNQIIVYENDDLGNIIDMKSFNSKSNELLYRQKFKYNSQGDEIESISYKTNGSIDELIKFEYKYDSRGNWILEQELSKEGIVYNEQQRIISYHSIISQRF